MNKSKSVKLVVISAMLSAMIALSTAFIRIPSMVGYVHIGDTFIYIASSLLPAPYALASSAVGGGLADLIAGFPNWTLPTIIIKLLNTLPFIIVRHYAKNDDFIISRGTMLMLIPSAIVTVAGYSIANLLMYDFGAMVAEVIGLCFQALIGSVLYIALGKGLDKTGFKKALLNL